MVHGIGVDIIDEERIKPLLSDTDDPFFLKTYTEKEREEAAASSDPLRYYVERFAAKEAVFKALRISPDRVRLNMIETLNDDNGAPYVNLYGYLEEVGKDCGISTIHISLTSEGSLSAAFAVAVCEG